MDNQNFLSEPQNVFSLLQEIAKNARLSIDKIWENAKFFTTITSAIVTISIAGLASAIKDKPELLNNIFIIILFSVLQIILIIISNIGIKNLRREYKNFLEWVITTQKLYELLGLGQELKFKMFPNDKYLLPDRFIDGKHNDSNEFIETNINRKGTLLYYFKLLHRCYIGIGILLIILIIFIKPL